MPSVSLAAIFPAISPRCPHAEVDRIPQWEVRRDSPGRARACAAPPARLRRRRSPTPGIVVRRDQRRPKFAAGTFPPPLRLPGPRHPLPAAATAPALRRMGHPHRHLADLAPPGGAARRHSYPPPRGSASAVGPWPDEPGVRPPGPRGGAASGGPARRRADPPWTAACAAAPG
jgi:hypothetical protein